MGTIITECAEFDLDKRHWEVWCHECHDLQHRLDSYSSAVEFAKEHEKLHDTGGEQR